MKLTFQKPGPIHKPAARPFRKLLVIGAGLMVLATGCASEKAKHENMLRQRVELRNELSLYALAPTARDPPKSLVRDFASQCLCGRQEAFHEVAHDVHFIMKEFVDSASVSQVQGEFDTVVLNRLDFLASIGFQASDAALVQLLRILKSPRLRDAPLTQARGRAALKDILKNNPQLASSDKITALLASPSTDSLGEVPLFCCDTGQIKFPEEKQSLFRRLFGGPYKYETPGSPYVRQH